MHVAFVLDDLTHGGAQRQAVALVERLRDRHGLRVSLVVYRAADFFGERVRSAGLHVVRLPKRSGIDPLFPLRLRRWLKEERVDVVNAFLLQPSLWSAAALRLIPSPKRPPLVVSERSSRVALSRSHFLLQRAAFGTAAAVTVNAEPMVEALAAKLKVPPSKLAYIPNGIDAPAWEREAAGPPPFPLDPAYSHLALVGRFDPVKNHALMLDALERVPRAEREGWRVWFVGAHTGGPDTTRAVRGEIEARGLGKTVRVVPPTRELAALLARIDVLALPSRVEGFPNVLLETLALGRMAVAAPVGDVPNLVRHEQTGLLFRAGDPVDLARKLRRACAMARSAEGERIGSAARRWVRSEFSLDRLADRHARLYRRLAEGGEPRGEVSLR